VPLRRQLVFHANRRLGHDDARDQTFRFELAQALRQHPIADVGDRIPQPGVALPSSEQELNDRTAPAAADQLDRVMKPGAQHRLQTHARILPKPRT
jgi:hypothetical protein